MAQPASVVTARLVSAPAPSRSRIHSAGGFGEPERWRFDWEWSYTRDTWLDQLPTYGILTGLAPDKLAEVVREAGAAVDALGGGFTMRYATVAVAAARTGGT
ncbi:hypothetical protein ACFV98_38425 [Streptomyces violascens]|uniref:hypothetical protein n=1 Tax=Streptomyces violascens TaxID=67381 RepID=UPI003663B04E